MRVAVTGASGFIGRYVVRELLELGVDVIAVSRHPVKSMSKEVTNIFLDIRQVDSDAFRLLGESDALLHLAWGGLPNFNSMHHIKDELPAHYEFCKNCINNGLKNLIVVGTCLEYGLQSGELSESVATKPVTSYGMAKRDLYDMLSQLQSSQESHFGLGWLRLFYLFGVGQAPTALYSQLLASLHNGSETFDMSMGDQVRDFLDIRVAAEYIAKIVVYSNNVGCVNICSGEPVSVLDKVLAWLSERQSNISLNRGVYPYPDYEPFAFWGSTEKLNQLRGRWSNHFHS